MMYKTKLNNLSKSKGKFLINYKKYLLDKQRKNIKKTKII